MASPVTIDDYIFYRNNISLITLQRESTFEQPGPNGGLPFLLYIHVLILIFAELKKLTHICLI